MVHPNFLIDQVAKCMMIGDEGKDQFYHFSDMIVQKIQIVKMLKHWLER